MLEKIREFWRGFIMGKENSELNAILLYLAGEILRDIVTARDDGGLLPAAFPIVVEVGHSDFMIKMEIGYKDDFAKYKLIKISDETKTLNGNGPEMETGLV